MKEGAPAGKRFVPEPCLPSAKEGGIEGREGIRGGSSALSMEKTTALCSREIHPPVRAGQSLPGPGGSNKGQSIQRDLIPNLVSRWLLEISGNSGK